MTKYRIIEETRESGVKFYYVDKKTFLFWHRVQNFSYEEDFVTDNLEEALMKIENLKKREAFNSVKSTNVILEVSDE